MLECGLNVVARKLIEIGESTGTIGLAREAVKPAGKRSFRIAHCSGDSKQTSKHAGHDRPEDDKRSQGHNPLLETLSSDNLHAILAHLDRVAGHLRLGEVDHVAVWVLVELESWRVPAGALRRVICCDAMRLLLTLRAWLQQQVLYAGGVRSGCGACGEIVFRVTHTSTNTRARAESAVVFART